MTLFVFSFVFLLALVVPILIAARKNWPEKGSYITWGQSMLAAGYAFFIMFWAYGVVPHQWLTWADSELNWRPDRIVAGPGKILNDLPFEMSYQTLRDIIVVLIYVVFLGGQIALWAVWQSRGEVKPGEEVTKSRYGRPLVRQGQG